jgi:DNA polymerase III subunit delta'
MRGKGDRSCFRKLKRLQKEHNDEKMIIGHQRQKEFLERIAKNKNIPHALLFCGQEHLGKKALAFEFAQYLNCSGETKPCKICKNCKDIEKGVYPDFSLIEPEASKKSIQISQIRELIAKLSFYSYLDTFKIAVIDNAHLMTLEAQNSFLKELEEPKGKTILILITEYPETLLPTILSRLQRIRFSTVSVTEIENYLIKQGIGEQRSKEFSRLSFGRPGIALNFILDSKKFEGQKKIVSDIVKIASSEIGFRFKYAKNMSEEKENLIETLDIWLRYLRNIFLSKLYGKKEISGFNRYSLSKLKNIILNIQQTKFLISTTNVNPKLALENLLITIEPIY